jgi:8-oxo-dGTP diphosphatase
LLLERKDNSKWNLPGGRVNKFESPRKAAKREAKEETGYDIVPLWQIGEDYSSVSSQGEIKDIARIFFCKVIGGQLKNTSESKNHGWYSLETLSKIEIVVKPCPGYPEGRTKAMIIDALNSYVCSSFSK